MAISKLNFFPYVSYPLARQSTALNVSLDRFILLSNNNSLNRRDQIHYFAKICQPFLLAINEKIQSTFNKYKQIDNNLNRRIKMQPAENPIPIDDKDEEYKALLLQQIKTINQWNDLPEDKQERMVENFMDAIGHLYLDYYQFHIVESRACALEHQTTLENAIGPIITYISNLESRLWTADAMDDPWEIACWGRTNIEALVAMFGRPMEVLDYGRLEIYMKNRVGSADLEDEQIPKNVPSSHWWWFEKYH